MIFSRSPQARPDLWAGILQAHHYIHRQRQSVTQQFLTSWSLFRKLILKIDWFISIIIDRKARGEYVMRPDWDKHVLFFNCSTCCVFFVFLVFFCFTISLSSSCLSCFLTLWAYPHCKRTCLKMEVNGLVLFVHCAGVLGEGCITSLCNTHLLQKKLPLVKQCGWMPSELEWWMLLYNFSENKIYRQSSKFMC